MTTPTRAQKRTWRRRMHRTRYSSNRYRRAVAHRLWTGIIVSTSNVYVRERAIVAPWLRPRAVTT